MFGLGPAEKVRTIADFIARVHPDDRAAVTAMCERCARDGTDFDLEFRAICADASVRWLHDVGKVFFDAERRPIYMTGACLDISLRKQAQEERERLLESERAARGEAERANRLKDQFLATLSHELRTPLNAILGWAHILQGRSDPASTEKGLGVIERNARLQAQLIDELLDMSRIVSGKLRLDVQRVDLAAVIGAAVESSAPAAEARDVRIVTALQPDAGAVDADPARIQQIVWNLLSNAIKFTPAGGQVEIALARRDDHIAIRVSDTGSGIDADFLPHLFERFRQADAAATRAHSGLGLGLAIVRSLVQMHGGRVWAQSDGAGRGATFTVELPCAAEHGAASDGTRKPENIAHRRGLIEGVQVLVVDDEPDVRDLVRRLLEDQGARVLLAADAQAAFAHLEHARPDVILSDIGMPREDGYSFMRRLRALPAALGGDVPAAALTAFARTEDRARALDAGFQLHLAKPLDPSDLVMVVASLAGRIAPSAR
jgi:signal transduction histidine kinase/CheY-like chemotaxis protein